MTTLACPHPSCGAPLDARGDGGPQACPRCGLTARVAVGKAEPSWLGVCELSEDDDRRAVLCSHGDCDALLGLAGRRVALLAAPGTAAISDASETIDAVEIEGFEDAVDDGLVDPEPVAIAEMIAATDALPGTGPDCPVCQRALLRCPAPGCDGVLPDRDGRCDRCGEAYTLCRGECASAGAGTPNRALARYCRGCGASLRPAPPASPAALGARDWWPRPAALDWVRLPGPFEPTHRKLVFGARIAGVALFALPTGALVARGRGFADRSPATRLGRLFPAEDFAARRELIKAPPTEARYEAAGARRRLWLVSGLRRVVAVAPDEPGRVDLLLDVERRLGEGMTLVGGPVAWSSTVLLAARRAGTAGVELVLCRLGGGTAGAPELSILDRRAVATPRKLFLGPAPSWHQRASVFTPDELLTFGDDGSGRLTVEQRPLFGDAGVAQGAAPAGFALFAAAHAHRAGNPTWTGERLVLLGRDLTQPGENEASAVYELVLRDGGPRLRRIDRGIPETEVPLVACDVAGHPRLVEVWARRLHALGLFGRRTLDFEPHHDQLGDPAFAGDLLAVRRTDDEGFELYRVSGSDGGVDLAAVGRLALPGLRPLSAPLLDDGGADVLVGDPADPARVAIARVDLLQPERLPEDA